MTITFRFIERNDRRKDIVTNNGFDIAIDLPALAGTEKQIAWASKIRDSKVRGGIEEMLRKHPVAKLGMFTVAEHDAAIAEINGRLARLDSLFGKATEARFWIDMRDTSFATIGGRLQAEHGTP